MKLKVVNGASQPEGCNSWLEYWEKYSGQSRPHFCTVKGCMKIDMVAVCVKKADGSDDEVYVYPMCSTHSKTEGVLDVADNFNLVDVKQKAAV
ncbi:MAG: hypothetical protein JW712_01350 [Dehalococcoidales bacterium]|nr:hypothetical protein [Dehalococcoidales bacterium]